MSGKGVIYDPIWRRIRKDSYSKQFEGRFWSSLARLEHLNNWGSLSWLYPHATATKLAHHHGVQRNTMEFLNEAYDDERQKYRHAFRIASHTLHWGHLPLSYAGCESLIRASNVSSDCRNVLTGILDLVQSAGNLNCTDPGHSTRCVDSILDGSNRYDLYKWFSAWLVVKRWKQIYRVAEAVERSGSEPLPDSDTLLRDTIRTLVCQDDTGYRLLAKCNLADYVPRDLHQAGTAWLSVDIETLWEISPNRPDSAKEWTLLEAARDYLDERFFHTPEAILIHTLTSRVIAAGLLTKPVSRRRLESWASDGQGDLAYHHLLPEYHRKRLRQVETWARSSDLDKRWQCVGVFSNVLSGADKDSLDIENELTGRSGAGRLSYPFTAGFSVVADLDDDGTSPLRAGEGHRFSIVTTHWRSDDGGSRKARPLLDIVLRVANRQSIRYRHQAPSRLVSWFLGARVRQRSRATETAIGNLLASEMALVRECLSALKSRDLLGPLDHEAKFELLLNAILDQSFDPPNWFLGAMVLKIPWRGLNSAAGRRLLQKLKQVSLGPLGDGDSPGTALEVAVLADQYLAEDPCTHRLVFSGATSISEEGRDQVEWDVIRIDLDRRHIWRLYAVECSVTRSTSKKAIDRDRLEILRENLQPKFDDLTEFHALFGWKVDGQITYEDAGRGFRR